jgi:peptidylprolyl isomerase
VTARLLIPLICAPIALGLAACGGDDDSSSQTTGSSSETASADATAADTSTKPEVEVPAGDPPQQLEVKDLVEGTGPEAKTGDLVTVQYVGVDYATGEEFDASWDRGAPFPFTLGAGDVISGWDLGVAGMKVGGRRELIIPPDLAYGAQGQPPAIAPNSTLIFVIDLLAVE